LDHSAHNKAQSEYWDRVAWDKTCTLPLPLHALEPLLKQNTRILDYGCGYGRLAGELWERGYRQVIGVDVSAEMVRRGKQMFPDLDLRHLPGLPLPHPEEAFDLVLLAGVLTALPEDAQQQAVIGEARRVLAPGGIVCLIDFLIQGDERNLRRYEAARGKHLPYGVFELPDGAVLRHHSREWIEALTSPFDTLHWSRFQAATMNGHHAEAFCYLGRKTGGPRTHKLDR